MKGVSGGGEEIYEPVGKKGLPLFIKVQTKSHNRRDELQQIAKDTSQLRCGVPLSARDKKAPEIPRPVLIQSPIFEAQLNVVGIQNQRCVNGSTLQHILCTNYAEPGSVRIPTIFFDP